VGTAVGYASNVAPVIGAAWVSKKIVKSIKKHQDKKKARKEKLAKECVELKGEILKNPIYIRESADELFALIDYIYS
jgi:phage terminase small subunit